MTETSLLPQAAAALNITFPKLLDTIIAAALRRETTWTIEFDKMPKQPV